MRGGREGGRGKAGEKERKREGIEAVQGVAMAGEEGRGGTERVNRGKEM